MEVLEAVHSDNWIASWNLLEMKWDALTYQIPHMGKLLVPTGVINTNSVGQKQAGIKVTAVSDYHHQIHPL